MIAPIQPYDLPQPAKAQLLDLAGQSDIFLLGEIHGTQEVSALVLGLFDDLSRLGYGGLGLEIPQGQKKQLSKWAVSIAPPPDFFGPTEFRDGRGNVQVLSLIKQMHSDYPQWELLCFDTDMMHAGETGTDRDRAMAETFLEQKQERCAGRKVIAVCGNYHSRLFEPEKPDFGPWPSFGANILQRRPDLVVTSVDIVFHGGGFFNGEEKEFRPGRIPLNGNAEVRPGGWLGHTAELHLPYATPATFL